MVIKTGEAKQHANQPCNQQHQSTQTMSLWLLVPVSPPLPAPASWWDRIDWMLMFNGVLAFTAIAGIIFLWRQVSLARDQIALAREQFDEAKNQIAASAGDTANMIANATAQATAMGALAKANEDSAAVMLRQLEAYERPWVTASFESQSRLDFDDSGLWVTFRVWLKNIGRSIATHINYEVEIVPSMSIADDYGPVISTQDAIAKRITPQAGYVLFARERLPVYKHLRMENDSIKRHIKTIEGEQYLMLRLAGIITYRYPTSDRPHTTRIAFAFGNYEEPWEGWLFVKVGQALPPEKITILKLPVGGGAD